MTTKNAKKAPTILPHSLHKSTGWKSQFERTERWYNRVINAETKEDIIDYLFAYFQNCYLLREWLILTSELKQSELDDLFSENVELVICRDICNVTKNFSISRPSQEFELSIIQEYCNPNSPYHMNCWFGGDAKLTVVTDSQNYDALELARCCFEIWRRFLKSKGILCSASIKYEKA